MNILIRLPNWLGDVVMSAGFLRALHQCHPQARLHLVSKAELAPLLPALLPPEAAFAVHSFAKKNWAGPLGPWRFGRKLKQQYGPFDRYYCLPNSFSTALLGLGAGATTRVGYATEGRGLLLTHALRPRPGRHRADDYTHLLTAFAADTAAVPPAHQADVRLRLLPHAEKPAFDETPTLASATPLLFNFNSEAPARRMPIAKAAAIIRAVRSAAPGRPIGLLGSPREVGRAAEVLAALPEAERSQVQNLAGQTNLVGLLALLNSAALLFSTDSGPAHVANALGTPLVVCFGPGHETSTGPYHPDRAIVVRAPGAVPCGGCTNSCRYGEAPPCLLNLDEAALAAAVLRLLAAP